MGRRSNDAAISRCTCHGAWAWHGICPVGIDPRDRVIRVFAAELRAGPDQPSSREPESETS